MNNEQGNQLIPHIYPSMLKEEPDQVSFTLNRMIDAINTLLSERTS